ncbi:serine/threonine-protein kinase [Naumannella cuiyingiana]|uniref:Serine/threonine-protein kinase n=1 Tax=Naumannella cuiyingiana TaxID=1347891 RepID=A0A7Z0DBS6_9ACTN|nr:serine/threonine protein kinase [Naumannella cuiyingiana]NYI72414.1 serine/threonine-protein kinase [Naumannella cuiyingiana]
MTPQAGPPPPPAEVAALGEVVAATPGSAPGTVDYAIRDRAGQRHAVTAAPRASRGPLDAAAALAVRARIPLLAPISDRIELTGGGLALVRPWLPGRPLEVDPARPGDSALELFVAQDTETVLGCLDKVIGAHVALARHGLIAVAFHSGRIRWDFDALEPHLVGLESYRGAYRLDSDRAPGDPRFMAPEEFRRGAAIDQPATVFALGRTAQVLLGRTGRTRIGPDLLSVVLRAVADDPTDRYARVATFATAWMAARMIPAPRPEPAPGKPDP